MHLAFQQRILALLAEDLEKTAQITHNGELLRPSNPEVGSIVRSLRDQNRAVAAELESIIAAIGWPGVSQVGEAAALAAYRLVAHSMTLPDFQRRMLALMKVAASNNDLPWVHVARLEDRICALEGRPQMYGTIFRRTQAQDIVLDPYVDDLGRANGRRAEFGLPPIEAEISVRQRVLKAWTLATQAPLPNSNTTDADMATMARLLGWRGE